MQVPPRVGRCTAQGTCVTADSGLCCCHACLLLLQVWLQQVKYNWRDSPPVTEFARKLSLECQDLLDKVWQQERGARATKYQAQDRETG